MKANARARFAISLTVAALVAAGVTGITGIGGSHGGAKPQTTLAEDTNPKRPL